MAFTLTSPAFGDRQAIPIRYTCDGENISPALPWIEPPAGTAMFALVMDDPDAPSGTFTHWLLSDIPVSRTTMQEGIRTGIGTAGTNDFGRSGYGGPCPPKGHGPHHYGFHLHALGRALTLAAGFTREDMDAAFRGHVLATTRLTATYERGSKHRK